MKVRKGGRQVSRISGTAVIQLVTVYIHAISH